jgi:hypothetical protein
VCVFFGLKILWKEEWRIKFEVDALFSVLTFNLF